MKKNLTTFHDRRHFVSLSELKLMVEGFERSKWPVQEHLIGLFKAAQPPGV
jgi:hypothetical protein